MKTNLMYYLSSVYLVSLPLQVSGIFVVHQQEAYCIYTTIGTCAFQLIVCWPADMHQRPELPFVDEFRWVSPLHFVKNEWQNAVPLWCMLQAGPPFLHYCCAVVLRSSIVLPAVGHSSNHEYHCCQLTKQSSGVSNFYHTFKLFIWLTVVLVASKEFYI